MDVLVTVLIAGLATWQLVDLIHHSEIAAPVRKWAEGAGQYLTGPFAFAGRAVSCPYCLAHWAALFCLVLSAWPGLRIIVWALAASRLANAGNDLFKNIDLTPKHDREEPVDDPTIYSGSA